MASAVVISIDKSCFIQRLNGGEDVILIRHLKSLRINVEIGKYKIKK